MKTHIFLIFLLLNSLPSVSQTDKEIILKDFSSIYSGKIIQKTVVEEDTETNVEVVILDKKTNKKIFSAFAFFSDYDLEEGQAKTNIHEIPYGEQSILIYEDFNFDNVKDLAIRVGNFSCYGGPAYDVYLAKNNNFEPSESLTELAQSFCGFFSVDHEKKQLSTMTKSGCCWHQYNTYIVENDQPVLTESTEVGLAASGLFVDYSISKLENGKLITKSYQELSADIHKPLFEMTFKNGKKMVLIQGYNENLNYVFVNKENVIELIYSDYFSFDAKKQKLFFENENTIYEISEKGIHIKTSTKAFDFVAVKVSHKKITKEIFAKCQNVVIK